MTKRKKSSVSFKHPLADLVLSAFEGSRGHDRVTIADFLGAPTRPPKGLRAYLVVAEDVLLCLEKSGELYRSPEGWFFKVDNDAR